MHTSVTDRNKSFFLIFTIFALSFINKTYNCSRRKQHFGIFVEIVSLQCGALKSKVSSLDNQLEKISGQLKAEEGKCRELENKLKLKENEWKMDKAALEEKAKTVSISA